MHWLFQDEPIGLIGDIDRKRCSGSVWFRSQASANSQTRQVQQPLSNGRKITIPTTEVLGNPYGPLQLPPLRDRILRVCCRWLSLVLIGPVMVDAQEVSPASESARTVDDEVIVLSPFQVLSNGGPDYGTTNAITATRLSSVIKDLPLSLEVVTNEFMHDTGSVDLREAMNYSAGVVLESQYEGLTRATQMDDPISAGANDPEGQTRNVHQSSYKIRGFGIDSTLRDGFRRQAPTDWINMQRVEILRGPGALLYGLGSPGGTINYIVKRPLLSPRYYVQATFGSHDFHRLEFDATDQFNPQDNLNQGYRITGSWQSNGDYGDGTYQRDSWFVAPVLTFELPNGTTSITLDTEFGGVREEGIGFNSVRSWISDSVVPSDNQLRMDGFIIPGGGTPDEKDVRTWRWSGEDTFIDDQTMSILADIQQRLGRETWLRAGVQYSRNESTGRNVRNASLQALDDTRWSYSWYRDPETTREQNFIRALERFNPTAMKVRLETPQCLKERRQIMVDLFERRPANMWYGDIFEAGPVESSSPLPNLAQDPDEFTSRDYVALAYQWAARTVEDTVFQGRVELAHDFDLAGTSHSILVGAQAYDQTRSEARSGAPAHDLGRNLTQQAWNLTSVINPTRIRFDVQGDGVTPSVPIEALGVFQTDTRDRGVYGVLQSRLWEDRLNLVLGARWSTTRHDETTFGPAAGDITVSEGEDYQTINPQVGLSVALSPHLSVFGVYSTGFQPNYGAMDGNGRPFDPIEAENLELGVKFDLLEGRLSGTISAFEIKRSNIARDIWWAPSPGIPAARKGAPANYDPNQRAAVSNTGYHPYLAWLCMDQPGFKEVDPDAYAFWKGVPRDPRDPTKPYGYGDPKIPAGMLWDTGVDIVHSSAPDPDGWARKTFGQMWIEHGDWTQEQYDNWQRYLGTFDSSERFTLIPIDNETDAGRAGRYLIEQGIRAQVEGHIGWFNWLYEKNGTAGQFADGTPGIVNSYAAEYGGASLPYEDYSHGLDLQLLWSPVDGLQILGGYAYVESEVTTERYDYVAVENIGNQAELGIWNFPGYGWGTFGLPASLAYEDPTDTSTSTLTPIEYGGPLDDTPRHIATFWTKYDFLNSPLRGLGIGFGGKFESESMYLAGVSMDGTGIGELNEQGEFEVDRLYTQSRITLNGLIEYNFRVAGAYGVRVALNLYNLTDDKGLYGFLYAPGRSARLSVGLEF